jgi:hypothetical protein
MLKKRLPPLFYWLKFACGAFSGTDGGGFDWLRAKGQCGRTAAIRPFCPRGKWEAGAFSGIDGGGFDRGGQKAWFLPAGKWEAGAFSGGNGGPLCIR